jgi:3-hydroxyisobutyrate dehydrogenase
MSKLRVGFVGVGRMGANMARRLHERGHPLTVVYDTQTERAAALARELSCVQATTLVEVTRLADVIFTVVSDDAAQLSVLGEPGGGDTLLAAAAGKIFVHGATLTPRVHAEAATRARAAGAATLTACMASSIPQARAGTLYLMCGGERAVFDQLTPILNDLSAAPRLVGTSEQAAQLKALVNMVMNIHTAALAEGLGLAAAMGLELDQVRGVFAETGAASQVLRTDGEDMQARSHDCFFSAAHAAKDSSIAWTLGCETGLHLPLAAATKLQYDRLVALGSGGLDKSAVAELTFRGRHA